MLISSLGGVRQFSEENPSREPCETDETAEGTNERGREREKEELRQRRS